MAVRPAPAPTRPRLRHGCVAALTLAAGLTATAASAEHAGAGAAPAPPAAVRAAAVRPIVPRLAGCPLFPASDAWRQDISKARLSPRSAAWVRSVGRSLHLHPDFGSNPAYGIPYSTVPRSQPKVRVTFTAYGSESDPGPYPIPRTARIEAGSDRHVLVASANCHLYELFDAHRAGSGWRAASGAVFDLTSTRLRPRGWTSADAAGLPILPGLVRPDEIRAGQIDHALRFTVALTQRGFIAPATHQAGATSSPDVPPMGARFRLKASFSLRPFHGAALIVLRCLKKYGMFVADNGSNWYLSGASWRGWNDADLDQLKRVPGSAFEVVDSGPVQP